MLKKSKVKATKPAKPAKLKQTFIAGTAPEVHKDIESAADEYRDIRDKRMQLSKPEAKLKQALKLVMQKHKLKEYKFANVKVVLVPGEENVKVKTLKPKAPKKTSRQSTTSV